MICGGGDDSKWILCDPPKFSPTALVFEQNTLEKAEETEPEPKERTRMKEKLTKGRESIEVDIKVPEDTAWDEQQAVTA